MPSRVARHDTSRWHRTFTRRQFLQVATASTAAITISPGSAVELDYPVRPIRLVVGFLPGSAADAVARIMSRWLSRELRQAVIIENKAGAASNIAMQALIRPL
jgi:tripartite-type tricarboxylate transporter receptor subunit TctC